MAAGLAERAIASQELGAVTGEAAGGVVDVEECDAIGELRVVRVARQQCAALGFDLGHHVHHRSSARRSPSTHST